MPLTAQQESAVYTLAENTLCDVSLDKYNFENIAQHIIQTLSLDQEYFDEVTMALTEIADEAYRHVDFGERSGILASDSMKKSEIEPEKNVKFRKRFLFND